MQSSNSVKDLKFVVFFVLYVGHDLGGSGSFLTFKGNDFIGKVGPISRTAATSSAAPMGNAFHFRWTSPSKVDI